MVAPPLVCDGNQVYLLHGFRLNAAPADRGARAAGLRRRLLASSWSEVLTALFEGSPHADATPGPLRDLARHHAEEALRRARAVRSDPQAASSQAAAGPDARQVWLDVPRDTARKGIHSDLLPVVEQLLHGGRSDAAPADAAEFLGQSPLDLNPALPLLQQDFWLELGPAARARLRRAGVPDEEALHLGVRLCGVRLYVMASGLVLAVIGLRVGVLGRMGRAGGEPVLLPLLQEAVYAIGHAGDRGQVLRAVRAQRPRRTLGPLAAGQAVLLDAAQGHAARAATADELARAASTPASTAPRELLLAHDGDTRWPLLLADDLGTQHPLGLLHALLGLRESPTANDELQPLGRHEHGRSFTFSAVLLQADAPASRLPELAYRLGRRLSDDYALSADDVRAAVVRPFENVCHAMATQGAALVVRNADATFVRQFLRAALPNTYLPLAIVNFHEYLHLLRLTQESAFMPDPQNPERDALRLRQLRSDLVTFRLFFSFGHVSDLEHHNRVHRAWRAALDLDRMLADLSQDVVEGERVLSVVHQQEQARQHAAELRAAEKRARYWRRWSVAGVLLGSMALVLHVGESVLRLRNPDRQWMLQLTKGDGQRLDDLEHDPRFAAALELAHKLHREELLLLAAAVVLGSALALLSHLSGAKSDAGH